MYDHTLHHGRKHFFCYFYKLFVQKKYEKVMLIIFFKINGKQMNEMPKNVRFKNYERKIKSLETLT